MKLTKGKISLIILLILLGGFFSAIYATTSKTVSINSPQGAPNIARIIDQQIDNEKIGPYENYPTLDDIASDNEGKIDNGNLFFIWPRSQYKDGLWVQLELVNRKKLDEKYNFFNENIAIYQATSDNSKKWENNQNWNPIPKEENILTLSGKPLTFQIKEKYIDSDYPIVVALDNGQYQVKDNTEPRPKPIHYLSVEEGEY